MKPRLQSPKSKKEPVDLRNKGKVMLESGQAIEGSIMWDKRNYYVFIENQAGRYAICLHHVVYVFEEKGKED